ncbi:MAG TPA: ABC transporter ATP-binding protein [Burkholderiaceae bacterium]|nr:ABC transporter ATP-binding protein [Burkholderiaceae bacterium]
MSTGTPLLDASGLLLRAGARELARDLSLRVSHGELWCVLGPNGSGKTTLLHTLAGVRAPAAGSVRLLGSDIVHAAPEQIARRRGLLTQTVHDSFSASALEVVLLGRHPHQGRWSFDDDDDRRIAHDALAAVDAATLAARDVTTLSGGERQRVAIAALLAQRVPLMLLDEPTAHLDLKHQIGVLEHLRGLAQAGDCAAVIALHDLNLAARFGSHALVLGGDAAVAGRIDDVMTEDALSAAFQHPLRRLRTGQRWTYIVD